MKNAVEKIHSGDTLVGIAVRGLEEGSKPITDGNEPLQLVGLKHPKGHYFEAHKHTLQDRTAKSLQECLIVKKGKIEIDVYNSEDKKISTVQLAEGELFILLHGGYGIRVLEDAELFELKNGPFLGDDKILI